MIDVLPFFSADRSSPSQTNEQATADIDIDLHATPPSNQSETQATKEISLIAPSTLEDIDEGDLLDLESVLQNEDITESSALLLLPAVECELSESSKSLPTSGIEQTANTLSEHSSSGSFTETLDFEDTDPIQSELFSIHSNLPGTEYHRVFGVPDEIVHTMNDLTAEVDRTLSMESNTDPQSVPAEQAPSPCTIDAQAPRLETQENQDDYLYLNDRYDRLLDHLDRLHAIMSTVSEETALPDVIDLTPPTPSNRDYIKNDDVNIPHDSSASTSVMSTQAIPVDDYPWYSNHYAVIDAEARLYRLASELVHRSEDEHSLTPVTSEPTIIPAIQLAPSIVESHPEPTLSSPTIDTQRKKKPKKKNKKKSEQTTTEDVQVEETMVVLEPALEIAPSIPPVSLSPDTQTLESASPLPVTLETTPSSAADPQPSTIDLEEDPPASKKKRNKHKKQKKEATLVSQLDLAEDTVVEEETTQQPPVAPTLPQLTITPKVSPISHGEPEEEQDINDDEGFQLVRHRKPPTPAARSKPKQKSNSNRDLGRQYPPTPLTTHPNPNVASSQKPEKHQPQLNLNESPESKILDSSPSVEDTSSLVPLTTIIIDPSTPVVNDDTPQTIHDTSTQASLEIQDTPLSVVPESVSLSEVPTPGNDVQSVIAPVEAASHVEDEQPNTLVSTKMKKKRKKKPSTAAQQQPSEVLSSPTTTTSNDPSPKAIVISSPNLPVSLDIPARSPPIGTNQTFTKLDIFLPEYIRQQINSAESSLSSSVTSSPVIPKKKNRSNILANDPEAKELLTSPSDPLSPMDSPLDSSISTTQTIDASHSRGFRLWFQESHALSQRAPTLSTSSGPSTQTMQQLVLQPAESDDEESSIISRSTYVTDASQEKRIHARHAYCINHPESFSPVPVRDQHSPKDAQSSDLDKHDQNAPKKQNVRRNVNPSSKSKQKNTQRHAGGLVSNHLSMNYDDWAHFIEDRFPSDPFSSSIADVDLLPSMNCFYARPLNEDTYVSHATPIPHPHRYGDFSVSNPDSLVARSFNHPEEQVPHRLKPSESFQRWRKPELRSTEYSVNDEIFVSHSDNGLCRRVKQ